VDLYKKSICCQCVYAMERLSECTSNRRGCDSQLRSVMTFSYVSYKKTLQRHDKSAPQQLAIAPIRHGYRLHFYWRVHLRLCRCKVSLYYTVEVCKRQHSQQTRIIQYPACLPSRLISFFSLLDNIREDAPTSKQWEAKEKTNERGHVAKEW